MFLTNHLLVDTDFYSMKQVTNKSMDTSISLVMNILQNIFFCDQQKKENHTGLEQHEGSKWQNYNFLVNYPFKYYG